MKRSRVLFAAISMVLAGTSGAPIAYAQAQASSSASLEEVVVTARKREETLIEVPVAVSVLSQKDIQQRGVQNLQDVALFTPGLTYFDSIQSQLGTPVIRGISQTNLNSPDRNVAIFYGGVYLSNSNASNLEILDVERIEVVKGPQSALYGRNAFNGAINYVPAAPTKDFASTVSATAGSDSRYEVKFMLSGPVTDTLGGRIAGSYNTFDGTWANAGDPYHNLGGYETKNVSGMLDWNPTEAFEARLFGYYTDDVRGSGPMYFIPGFNCGPTGLPLSAWCGDLPTDTTLAANRDSLAFSRRVSVGSLELSYDFGPVALKAQFARNKADTKNYSDYSGGANDGAGEIFPIVNIAAPTVVLRQQKVPYMTGSGTGDSLATSQELRLESRHDARLRWTIGAFHFKNEAHTMAQFVFDGRGLAVGEIPRDQFAIGSRPGAVNYTAPWDLMWKSTEDMRVDKQTAFFGAADFKVNDAITVGGELRRDEEDRSTESLLLGPTSYREGTFKYTTWRAHADYAFSPEQRIYASAAKGVISGFFNPLKDAVTGANVPVELQTYDPAQNITYEMGWKASWLDGRLSTELSLFYIDYTDIQINATPPPGLVSNLIQNIGDATGQGFEFALNYAVNDNWRLGATYSYTPTEFKDNTPDPSASRYCGNVAGLNAGFCPKMTFNNAVVPDVGGQPLPRSPDRLASGYVSFDTPLSADWSMFARADVSYTSSTPVLTVPLTYIASRTITNARIGVRNGPLQLELWGRNLLDEEYVAAAINQPPNRALGSALAFLPNATMGEGRTYGLTASYSFGGK